MKMGGKYGYLVFALTPDFKEVIVEQRGPAGASFEDFTRALPANDARYGLAHFSWEKGTNGRRTKIVLVHWSPSGTALKQKMLYAATKNRFKTSLQVVSVDIQAGGLEDLTPASVLEYCQRYSKD